MLNSVIVLPKGWDYVPRMYLTKADVDACTECQGCGLTDDWTPGTLRCTWCQELYDLDRLDTSWLQMESIRG